MKEVIDNPGYSYKLGRNVSLVSEEEWGIIGKTAATAFSGHFDGDGHTISDVTVTSQNKYAGLFGYNTGVIENLKVSNVNISGLNYVGGLVGYSAETLKNVSVESKCNWSKLSTWINKTICCYTKC